MNQAEKIPVLPFTGERVIPGQVTPDLQQEHMARYLFCEQVSCGKRVLDIGCGAGYGAQRLARRARQVVGVDKAAEAIDYARCRFGAPRLHFAVADALHLPFPDASFDVVVAFELLEHLSAPNTFLAEVSRVLRSGGVALISTPNRRTYSDARPGYVNPFHVREYYAGEFAALLREFFPAVCLLGQNTMQVQTFLQEGEVDPQAAPPALICGEETAADLQDTEFFLGLCGFAEEPVRAGQRAAGVVLAGTGNTLIEKDRWIRNLQQGVAARDLSIWNLRAQVDERTTWAQRLNQEISERDRTIRDLQKQLEEGTDRANQLQAQVAGRDAAIHDLQAQLQQNGSAPRLVPELREGRAEVAADSNGADNYRQLIRRIQAVVHSTLPHDATILVVSKGDDTLLQFEARRAWHFPQGEGGAYACYHPANSIAAIAQLEALRAKGGQFLLLPVTAFWWLDHYAQLRQHLEKRYRLIVRRDDVCAIYGLHEPAASRESNWQTDLAEVIAECRALLDQVPAILDWHTGLELAAVFPQHMVFSPPSVSSDLPYLDQTIDVVMLSPADPEPARLAEARRVARTAVATLSCSPPAAAQPDFAAIGTSLEPELTVDWRVDRKATTLPAVSIVIPSFNGGAYLETCLRALAETLPHGFRGEVLVVDDASTDDTPGLLERWAKRDSRLRSLRNPENAGFITSCNRGAGAAIGDILLFLNNDTLPLPGWLPPLLRAFEAFADAGAVGGKLLYPDGRLQEAGGVVFSDGSGANFGRGDVDAEDPLYSYVREVDYCSGAFLATRRALFAELGGFDPHYAPAYYEDTDYCFKLRQNGYRVYYQPESRIIHVEGASCGTDLASGLKHYQVLNRTKFADRWRDVLHRHPAPPGRFDRATWHLLAVRNHGEVPGG
jgi:GT2 family glycosyltransferase/2-polyprenyl-3-methyl-5-hydroxy-6-metoxy-1,4-benzoquinol methylase